MSELICVGSIAGAFGVKGEVRVKSYTADPLAIADYAPLLTQDSTQTFDIVITGQTKNGLTARMSGVVSKEDADALKGTQLFAPRDRLPETEEDEYYYADLINLSVYDTGGTLLGIVKSVQNHGASDLLEIKIADRSLTALLPFTKAAVPTVDIASGRIIADPPSGVFPDDDTK